MGLDGARGAVLVVGALGDAREDGGHRVDPDLGVRLQELDHLKRGKLIKLSCVRTSSQGENDLSRDIAASFST